MDRNTIRKFATWARREMKTRIRMKAAQLGFSSTQSAPPGMILDDVERLQLETLIRKIAKSGLEQTIEEAAYTWFNRFCALRFMEVNGYLPAHIRVFSDENNRFNPNFISESIYLGEQIAGIDMARVFELREASRDEELYKYLIIALCNALNPILPGIFTKLEDFTQILFPDYMLREGSIIDHLITDIPEDYFNIKNGQGQVEIIGWLYQYYISEMHDAVIDPLHGKVIKREDIPAATQVFTPDWVVQYIVDNTIGRLWIQNHPESNLESQLKYYISDESSCPQNITPQEITILDPCVGSGHFLVYAIDVLMNIYREYGYSDRDAISEIISTNIYGFDIDKRAIQLAYFSLMMKGCQYDRRFLKRGVQPQLFCIEDTSVSDEFNQLLCKRNDSLQNDIVRILETMKNASEYGALIDFQSIDIDAIVERAPELGLNSFLQVVDCAKRLSANFAVVITNPPYMNKYSPELKSWLQANYKDYCGDLFSAFIYRCIRYCRPGGYMGMMTPNVWMFIKSYEKLRRHILGKHAITTLVQMAKGAFYNEATVDVCAFVVQANKPGQKGVFFRLEDFLGNMDVQNEKLLEAIQNSSVPYRYQVSDDLFTNLPGMPIGYWAGNALLQAFKTGTALGKIAKPRQGMATTDNNKYLRHWYEVAFADIGFGLDRNAATHSNIRWFPYNKGGEFRKWYGNQDYVVNYQHDGREIKNDVLSKYPYLKNPDFVVKNPDTYFNPSLSWSKISSGHAAFRYYPQGFLYDVSGCSIFFDSEQERLYCAGFLNSIICLKLLEIISPTLNYETGHIAILPVLPCQNKDRICEIVQDNIRIAQDDWDSFETSWNFKKHPLI